MSLLADTVEMWNVILPRSLALARQTLHTYLAREKPWFTDRFSEALAEVPCHAQVAPWREYGCQFATLCPTSAELFLAKCQNVPATFLPPKGDHLRPADPTTRLLPSLLDLAANQTPQRNVMMAVMGPRRAPPPPSPTPKPPPPTGAMPVHCTSDGLTSPIISNVDDSSA